MLKDYQIGVLKGAEKTTTENGHAASEVAPKKTAAAKAQSEGYFIKILQILLPIIILAAALVVRFVTA